MSLPLYEQYVKMRQDTKMSHHISLKILQLYLKSRGFQILSRPRLLPYHSGLDRTKLLNNNTSTLPPQTYFTCKNDFKYRKQERLYYADHFATFYARCEQQQSTSTGEPSGNRGNECQSRYQRRPHAILRIYRRDLSQLYNNDALPELRQTRYLDRHSNQNHREDIGLCCCRCRPFFASLLDSIGMYPHEANEPLL